MASGKAPAFGFILSLAIVVLASVSARLYIDTESIQVASQITVTE
jgi:hypothetical protein